MSLEQERAAQIGAAGRLGEDYQRAVAELVRNPGAFFQVVLDERFDGASINWPNDPNGPARRVADGYRITPRVDNNLVAIAAPVGSAWRDALVGATFRKLGGPAGGVYGLFLRDRGPGQRDGYDQTGRFYLGQVDDRGEVSIWRREQESWIELVPWTKCDALRPGSDPNDLSFEVVGGRLTLTVNGRPGATTHDAILDRGSVGLFVGGNGSVVLVERFVVHALS